MLNSYISPALIMLVIPLPPDTASFLLPESDYRDELEQGSETLFCFCKVGVNKVSIIVFHILMKYSSAQVHSEIPSNLGQCPIAVSETFLLISAFLIF